MQHSLRVARIGGIDVHLNWTWLLAFIFMAWPLGAYFEGSFPQWSPLTAYAVGGACVILLFVTVLIHELAHSFTARACGLPVKDIYLFIFGGVSNMTREPQTPKVELLVAAAGPLASLILSGVLFALHAALSGIPSELSAIIGYLAAVNVLLAIFNLIPGFPLDGGRILRAVIWLVTGSLHRATRIATTVGSWIGYLFILGGIAEGLLSGQIFNGLWLAFIGWYLHNAATSSYQQSVMEHVLSGVEVRNVMDNIAVSTTPETPIETLVYRHLLNENQRAVPVVDDRGALLGLVTTGDTRHVSRAEWNVLPVERIMTPVSELRTVSPADSLRDALRILAENDYHQLPVLAGGRLVGMLNRSHVVQYLHVRERLAASSGDNLRRDMERDVAGNREHEIPRRDFL